MEWNNGTWMEFEESFRIVQLKQFHSGFANAEVPTFAAEAALALARNSEEPTFNSASREKLMPGSDSTNGSINITNKQIT